MGRGLHLRFEDPAAFRLEYERNIAKGGAFVRTTQRFELRAVVDVEVELAWCGECELLEAEIVHATPEGTEPRNAGVAVHFLEPAAELRERLARFAAMKEEPPAVAKFGADELELELEESLAEAARGGDAAAPSDSTPGSDLLEQGTGSGAERRMATRDTARVPARLSSSHLSLDGHTRDLSDTGVLLSADASDLPIGKRVALSLTHPNTGEVLEIAGIVRRHVASGGTVSAVGIQFDIPDDAKPVVEEFIREVRASENLRREAGISGVIEELGMANLLQMFGASGRGGTLTASAGTEEGIVAVQGGLLRYARLGGLGGIKALARMLCWERGTFEFQSHIHELGEEGEPIPLDAALLEAMRRIDEAQHAEGGEELDPRAVLQLHRDGLGELQEPLSQTEEAVLDLAAAGLTVRRLLDVIPESDADILAALRSLRTRGLVSLAVPE